MRDRSNTFLCVNLFLFLTSCSPSPHTSSIPIAPEPTRVDRKSDVCKLSKNISKSKSIPSSFLKSTEIDPSFENYIVQFKSSRVLGPSGNPLRKFGVETLKLNLVHGTTFTFKIFGSLEERKTTIGKLTQHDEVDFVEPDYPILATPLTNTTTSPDDPYFSKQWFHKTLNSLLAWQINEGSEDIVVAIVDTGIDYTHPDLKKNIWINKKEIVNGKDDDGNGYIDDIYGWNFSANTNDARSTTASPHGSHVAGLVGASGNNHLGVIGIAPKVKLMALKFMDDSGAGMTSNAIKAINYAIDKKVFLINNSWGSSSYSRALSDVVERAAKAGILFFSAAGNGSKGAGYDIDQKPWYPASYAYWNVFSVAATTSNDDLTSFSNFSKTKVDVAAPGSSIYSTVTGSSYQTMSGTSMATPIVSGLAVLVKAANPKLDPLQIINVLRESTDKVPWLKDKTISGGRINSYKAVVLANKLKAIPNCGFN